MRHLLKKSVLIAVVLVLYPCAAYASVIIESGQLNIIDDLGNPSNGLRYLDMSFSDGLTSEAALTNARATYANARLATPAEFDDLFAAAGILYDHTHTASSAFLAGPDVAISSGNVNYDAGALVELLGRTGPPFAKLLMIWTAAPSLGYDPANRDLLRMDGLGANIVTRNHIPGLNTANVGWLIVSEPSLSTVPEPSAFLCWLGLGLVGWLRLAPQRKSR